jgi:hypothetical protein
MTDEIHQMAADLIKEVGAAAPGQAACLSDLMLLEGRMDLARTWARISTTAWNMLVDAHVGTGSAPVMNFDRGQGWVPSERLN